MKFLLIFLSFFTYHAFPQNIIYHQDKNFKYKITVIKEDNECTIKSITITKRSNCKISQTIIPAGNYSPCNSPSNAVFIIEDMNFDGSNDFRIMDLIPSGQNSSYSYWVYDSKSQEFKQNDHLSIITTPVFHSEKKLITSSWTSGCCHHGFSTYKILNNKPILIKQVETTINPTNEVTTITKRLNGKMKIVKQTTKKIPSLL